MQANLLACTAAEAPGKAVNIAYGGSVSLLDLVDLINRELGSQIKPIFRPNRAGDVIHSKADISLARNVLNYNPEISFDEGLIKTVEYFRK